MNHRKGITGIASITVLVLAACGQEPEQEIDPQVEAAEAPEDQRSATPFEAWDANGDQALQVEEFTVWAAEEGKLEGWMSPEGGFDREAFLERSQEVWDADGDGVVTRSEWEAVATDLFSGETYGTFADWDANGDAELQAEEIATGHEAHGFFAGLDTNQDGSVETQELASYVFDVFDRNDDGSLDANEFEYGRVTWFDDQPGEPGA